MLQMYSLNQMGSCATDRPPPQRPTPAGPAGGNRARVAGVRGSSLAHWTAPGLAKSSNFQAACRETADLVNDCYAQYSATGTRARVARVRAEYPSQLDYSGFWLQAARRSCFQADLGDLGRLTAAGCSSPGSLLGPGNLQGTDAALPPQGEI